MGFLQHGVWVAAYIGVGRWIAERVELLEVRGWAFLGHRDLLGGSVEQGGGRVYVRWGSGLGK